MNKPAHPQWVAQMYPDLAARNLIRVINGSTGTALMDAVKSGDCSGAVAPDVHVRYALGPADPNCDFKAREMGPGVVRWARG